MRSIAFYQEHLDRVSRSFAFCIARLDGDMRLWVSVSYLLCRVLDTVEDAPWQDAKAKAAAFAQFQNFLLAPPTKMDCVLWATSFPSEIVLGEKLLLNDVESLFLDFHALPISVREKMRRSVLNMSRGMQHFARVGDFRLTNIAEVNQYCFFVAGLVGELLSDLLLEKIPGFADHAKLYLQGHHFGLFLQKINLLKDQKEDEKEGRYLVPSRDELLASIAKDAEGAIAYLQSVPASEKGYRLFCAWSLFLGLSSLPWIQKGWQQGILGKLPRILTERLLTNVEQIIDDNAALLKLFQKLLPALPKMPMNRNGSAPLDWFFQVYEGSLAPEHLSQLGMQASI